PPRKAKKGIRLPSHKDEPPLEMPGDCERGRPWDRGTREPIGAVIPVDDIVLRPVCLRVGEWTGQWEPREVDANKHTTLRIRVVNQKRVGAQYEMDFFIYYGGHNNPKHVYIKPFRVIVLAKE